MADGGVDFPLVEGKRPTTAINQGACAAAVRGVSGDAHKAVEAEKKWRFGYAKHVLRQTQLASESEEAALRIARDGLAYLHSTMEFARGGVSMPLDKAMAAFTDGTFNEYTVKGESTAKAAARGLEVPYNGKVLRGAEVSEQAEAWVRRGVIELDTGAALSQVASNPGWLDLSGHTFVLFGAGSAMGPFPILMALGAHVVALGRDRPQTWKRLLAIARASPGSITLPLRKPAPQGASDDELAGLAGCDLLTETPEVRNWLLKLLPDKRLVLGAYCYLDGPQFVRVSMAMDAIIGDLVQKRKVKPALAYLGTPTDALPCTGTARDAAAARIQAVHRGKQARKQDASGEAGGTGASL